MSDSISKKFFEQYNEQANRAINTLKVRYASNNTMYGKIPTEIIEYFFELSKLGKKTRGALTYLLLKDGSNVSPEAAINTSIALEFFHTAILVHDDVIDNSELRRSVPTVNIKYGVNQAICVGDYGFFLTHQLMQECDVELNLLWQATKTFNAYAIRLIQGQMAELDDISKTSVSLNRIFEIYNLKSGQYTFEMPLLIGYTLAGAHNLAYKETLRKYAYYTGVIFQIIDDYQDIFGELTLLGKPVGNDLREGKHTLFTYYLKNSTSEIHRDFINNNLGKSSIDSTAHNLYRTYLRECGAINKAKDVIDTFSENALKALAGCKELEQSEAGKILTELITDLKNTIS